LEIFALLDLCGCFLEAGNGLALVADLFAWFASAPNRTERREAKKEGVKLPPRSGWNWAFVILTVTVIVLTVLILIKYTVPRPRP
jgi:hypothetical protein